MKSIPFLLVLLLTVGCQTTNPTTTAETPLIEQGDAKKEFVIAGWVEKPGLYSHPLSNRVTVSELINLAGGLTGNYKEYVHRAYLENRNATNRISLKVDRWNTPLNNLGVNVRDFDQLIIRRRPR
jgi:protein involved in polysaccharide export with SLBB domain